MSTPTGSAPRILFVGLTNDVGSSRIVAEFGSRGAICAVLGASDCLAAASLFNSHIFELSSRFGSLAMQLSVRGELEKIIRQWSPDRIFPIDEMGSHLVLRLAVSAKVSADLRRILVASLGAPEHYVTTGSRGRLMQAAVAVGVRVPDFRILSDWASARAAGQEIGYPYVLKREYTCGGAGVTMIEDQRQILATFAAATLKTAAKRLIIAISSANARSDSSLIAQAFVPGTLGFRAVSCAEGRVLAGISFVCQRQNPPRIGSSTIIRQIDHAEMDAGAAALVSHLGCSGFVGFDYMIDTNGAAHMIEMNARPIGSGHLGVHFGHDLFGSYLADLRGEAAPHPAPDLASGQSIALFPHEMQRDPESDAFATGSGVLHDIPWNDPPVLAIQRAKLMASYPDKRKAIARILDRPDAHGTL